MATTELEGWFNRILGPWVLRKLGVDYTQRNVVELVEGDGVTIDIEDDPTTKATRVTISASGGGGPSVTVTSLSHPCGDPLGGDSIHVFGSGFVDGCAVTIGSKDAPVTSFVSATELIVTTPALDPGLYGVTVTNPDATSGTGTARWESWAPHLEDLDGYIRYDFGGDSPDWHPTASLGSSGDAARKLEGGTPPPVAGTAINGHVPARFDAGIVGGGYDGTAANAYMTNSDATRFLDSAASSIVVGLIYGPNFVVGSPPSSEPPLFATDSGQILMTTSTDLSFNIGVRATVKDSSAVEHSTDVVPVGVNTPVIYTLRYDGATLKLRKNNDADGEKSVAASGLDLLSGAARVGKSVDGSSFFAGSIFFIATKKGAISDALITKFDSWFSLRTAT